jgi:hypothetical protein
VGVTLLAVFGLFYLFKVIRVTFGTGFRAHEGARFLYSGLESCHSLVVSKGGVHQAKKKHNDD